MKLCTKCGAEKPLDAFSSDKSKRDGRKAQCKECVRSATRAAYSSDKRRKAYLATTPTARSRQTVRRRGERWAKIAERHDPRWLVEQVQSLKVTGRLTWDAIERADKDAELAALLRRAKKMSPPALRTAFGAELWDEVRGVGSSRARYVDRKTARAERVFKSLTDKARTGLRDAAGREWDSAGHGMAGIYYQESATNPVCDNGPSPAEFRQFESARILRPPRDGKAGD